MKNEKKWYLIDAKEQPLGRIATLIVNIISGTHRPQHFSNLNGGDYVIVINAEAIKVSGNKSSKKNIWRHSGRPGGLKLETLENLLVRLPEKIIENAVKNMLPKGSRGRDLFRNLKVYRGQTHPHGSQNPEILMLQ